MGKCIFILMLLSMSDLASHSQVLSQTLKGTVTDKETRMPLSGANILEINSSPPNGAVTDATGKLRLITGIGRITIKISYLISRFWI